jgi:four helix bundle protein
MNDFRNLQVWHKAHALTLAVYRATSDFPSGERFGLVAQIRRAAVSVPANIAESCGRRSQRDEAHLLQVAFGSACELEAELLLARDLGYLSADQYAPLGMDLVEAKRMLGTLARRTFERAVSHQPSAVSRQRGAGGQLSIAEDRASLLTSPACPSGAS